MGTGGVGCKGCSIHGTGCEVYRVQEMQGKGCEQCWVQGMRGKRCDGCEGTG